MKYSRDSRLGAAAQQETCTVDVGIEHAGAVRSRTQDSIGRICCSIPPRSRDRFIMSDEAELGECYQHNAPIESCVTTTDCSRPCSILHQRRARSLLRQRRPSRESREYFMQLRQRLLRRSKKLTGKEKMALLLDADSLICSTELWRLPAGALAAGGGSRCASTTCSLPAGDGAVP